MNIAIGAMKYITNEKILPLTLGITLEKSPTATSSPQSHTNPMNMSPMSPYTIRLVAVFLFSSSPPDTIRLKSPQVNIVTATPNANIRKKAIIFPIIPSNPAVFQKMDHPYVAE
jgi:hypothetical protein